MYNKQISIVNFNCFGNKNSSALVEKLSTDYDIVFLCEHWLRPDELPCVKSLYTSKDNWSYFNWSYFKSSVDPEATSCGRPHGGVGFIGKTSSDYTYRIKHVTSDRLCAIQIVNDSNVLLTVIGVYMPFYTGSSDQIELYVETLDILQAAVVKCGASSPLMIVGDFNTSLPPSILLRGNWHRSQPFTQYSYVLYEFLCHNNFGVANFAFNQNNNYTYFKGKNISYIDHCVIVSHFMDNVKNCEILSDIPDNCSDHFPIVTWCNLDVKNRKIMLNQCLM